MDNEILEEEIFGITDEEFEDTLDVVRKVNFEQIFMFIYSKREGTPAARMDDKITLLCVLNNREYYYLRSIALEIDPNAFIFVTKASEVHGEGFTYERTKRK